MTGAPGPAERRARTRWPLLAYGFRPFFLLAGVWAVVPMTAVPWALAGHGWPAGATSPFLWHGHEMLLGFVTAAIAGFLLTAVPSWTGGRPVSGAGLAGLVALWLAARLFSAPLAQPPGAVGQVLALAFLPVLAVTVAVPLARAGNVRNLPLLGALALLFAADVAFQGPRFGWFRAPPFDPLRLALNTVLLLVAVIGGRIVPAFTRNALRQLGRAAPVRSLAALDRAAIAAVAAVLVGDLLAQGSTAAALLAGLAAALLACRLALWAGWRTLDTPLLWVLHLGYAWAVVGLSLKSLWLLGGFAWAAQWMHALTAGAFGTMILAVTTRAALGHTGRALVASRATAAAYLLVTAAAALRVWGPWLAPGLLRDVLMAASFAWIAAFGTYLIVFVPVLARPRADGRPG